ncbi:MAG: hypothetical protein AAF585_23450, partial [Verrucomicrobiota bacterium]
MTTDAPDPAPLQQSELVGVSDRSGFKALVLVDEAPDLELWYAVPQQLRETALPGCRVSVPLRNRKVLGTVIQTQPTQGQEGFSLRPIAKLQHPKPLIPGKLLDLADWMSKYYACRLETAVRGMIPESIRTGSTSFKTRKAIRLLQKPPEEELEKMRRRAKRQAAILDQLDPEQPILLTALLEDSKSAASSVKRLEEEGWIEVIDQIQERDPTGNEEFLP